MRGRALRLGERKGEGPGGERDDTSVHSGIVSVGESLDFSAEISPVVLADAIVRKIAGLGSSGWILVLCRPDAEATWGMAPTPGRTRLLNGDEFCGTVETYLP